MTPRILFLCGSLPPGRDGVGDYTRALAAELTALGCDTFAVATHDRRVTEVVTEQQPQGGTEITVLRIPYATPNQLRLTLLQRLIDDLRPDYLSLQYVPYSFSNRGLPLPFALTLSRLRFSGRWHVMFHELWLEHRGLLTPKDTLIAGLQQLTVLLLHRRLRPDALHTHVPAYRDRLNALGLDPKPLPLFANIAPAGPARMEHDATTFRLGFFSQMQMKPGVVEFITDLHEHLRTRQRKLEIRLIGGGKASVATARETLSARLPEATIMATGFLSAERVSEELAALDLGISPVKYHTIGKSGTVAAFLRHGVPVAAPWVVEDKAGFFNSELLAAVINRFDADRLERATQAARILDTHAITVAGVATRFSRDLGLPVAAPSPRPS